MTKRLSVVLEATGNGQVTSHFNAYEMEGSDVPGMLKDCISELQAELALVEQCPANRQKSADKRSPNE